jgi:hypothetical protein
MLRQSLAALPAFLLALAFQLPFFDRWFSFMDEGHLCLFAELIANGGELYRDATVYPLPGAFWLLALAFRAFGASNLVARWIAVVEFALFVALLFALFRRMASTRLAWAAVATLLVYRVWAFPHWHMYSYSSTALLFQLAALAALLRFLDSGRRASLGLAGLLFGLGVLCKQDYGAAALAAFAVTLAVGVRTSPAAARPRLLPLAAVFLAPAALAGLAAGLHFWRAGLLGDALRFTVWNHFVGMASFEYTSFPGLLPVFGQDPALRSVDGLTSFMPAIVYVADWKLLYESRLFRETALYDLALKLYYYAPYPIVAWGLARLWRRRAELRQAATRRARLAELGLFCLGAALMAWGRINKPQDYVHLAVLYWPMLLLPLLWLGEGLARLRAARPRLWLAALALVLLPAALVAGYSARLAWRLRALHDTPIPSERAGLFATRNEAALLRDALDYLRTASAPDETVAVLPYFPILHFLAGRPGPDRSAYIVWPFPELPDRDRRVIASFEAKRPEILVYAFNRLGGFPDMRAYAPELFAYLVENYEIERIFSTDYLGYKLAGARRRRAGEDGRALGAELAAGALSVSSDEAPPRAIPPEERPAWLARDLWPFRPVVALRPSPGGAATRLALPLEVPPGGRLRTAVAVHPEAWYGHPSSWVRFEVAVRDGGERVLLYERTLHATSRLEDRGWFEVDVPLARFADRQVWLELATAAENATGATLAHGGFAEPRLVAEQGPSEPALASGAR